MRNRLFRNGWLLIAVAVSIVMGLSSLDVAQAQAKVPRYDKATCQFEAPQNVKVECGYLTVLEDRTKPKGNQIKLAVAVFKAQSKKPLPDPIIFLNGGPGGYTLKRLPSLYTPLAQFTTDRDLIFFDQRGVGFSEPALECPEDIKVTYDNIGKNVKASEQLRLHSQAIRACHDRLLEDGVNLSAYNTTASAADVNDLRVALGYRTWNLFGASYGTRLALITMRNFPRGIRSVVLDSSYPPQLTGFAGTALRAINLLTDGCSNDAQCNAAYPKLRTVLYNLIRTLNDDPVTVTAKHPVTGQEFDLLINGNSVIEAVYYALYSTRTIPNLPRIIFEASKGDYGELTQLVMGATVFSEEFGSKGAAYSVGCSDRIYSPVLCEDWSLTPSGPEANQPVSSSIPTLILAGEYDPVTPPAFGQIAAKTLRISYFFKFPGMGHGVSFAGNCPRSIMMAFFKAPARKPDSACIAKMTGPVFALPAAP
jgi:pimeloyl-ACP methyl ester carboxylesterase